MRHPRVSSTYRAVVNNVLDIYGLMGSLRALDSTQIPRYQSFVILDTKTVESMIMIDSFIVPSHKMKSNSILT